MRLRRSPFVFLLTISLLLSAAMPLRAEDRQIRLEVDGRELSPDQPPRIVQGRVLVPIRFVAEALGAQVQYDPAGPAVVITHPVHGQIYLLVGQTQVTLPDGSIRMLDVPAQNLDGRVFVPLRFVAEAFGAHVSYDPVTGTVTVANPAPAQDSGQVPATEPPAASDTSENAPANPSAPPEFATVLERVDFPGTHWLFATDDGDPDSVVLSAEQNNDAVVIGRMRRQDPTAGVRWQVVADRTDTGGKYIGDHWHIFAHGYHWMVFNVEGSHNSYLAKLDREFKRVFLIPLAADPKVITNDMFMVEEPDGVAVGHFIGEGTRIYRVGLDGRVRGTVDIKGGNLRHTNLASAQRTESGYVLLAPETGDPNLPSAIKEIYTDADWKPIGVRVLLKGAETHFAMATRVALRSGYQVITVRQRDGIQGPVQGQRPGSLGYHDSCRQGCDDGAVVRYILAPDGSLTGPTVLKAYRASRPHTTMIGDLLFTAWDQRDPADGGSLSRLRIERIPAAEEVPPPVPADLEPPATGIGAPGTVEPGKGEPGQPGVSPGGPRHLIYSATSKDGRTWTPDGELLFADGSVPGAVIKDGTIYLYFVDFTGTAGHVGLYVGMSADDGETWKTQPVDIPGGDVFAAADPHPVLLPDGRIRLYYVGHYAKAIGYPVSDKMGGTIYMAIGSAVSTDGVTFAEEPGARFTKENVLDPDIFPVGDQWVLLWPNGQAVSRDGGMTFTATGSQGVGGAPSTHRINGELYTFHCGSYGIAASRTPDGATWESQQTVLPASGTICDPTVVQLKDGSYKLFYKVLAKE